MAVEQVEHIPAGTWVEAQAVYESRAFGMDGGGILVHPVTHNRYIGSRFSTGNWGAVVIRRYSHDMSTVLATWIVSYPGVPHTPNTAILGVGKIDGFSMAPSGTDLLVLLGGHVTNTERENPVSLAIIAGAFI